VSLDHRLREAADVKEMVIELLSYLNEASRDGIAAVPLHVCRDADTKILALVIVCPRSGQQSPADPEPDELDECLEEVAHVITCLYKFSIAIQNPAPLHRLQKSSLIGVSHFEPFDIQHVSNKFPDAEPYLVQRLGRSNTRRRQLLRYYERHHDEIVGRYGLESLVLAPEEQGMSEGDHGKREESARLKSKVDERSEHRQQPSKKDPDCDWYPVGNNGNRLPTTDGRTRIRAVLRYRFLADVVFLFRMWYS